MKTYQDYVKAKEKGQAEEIEFIKGAINEYKSSEEYRTALDADEYEAERNVTILEFIRWLYTDTGQKVQDFTAANNKIASNFFHKLTTQRVSYSLGNGITFPDAERVYKDGAWTTVDPIKKKLGDDFDTVLSDAGKYSRIHGLSFIFWNKDHADYFKMTEFLPLYDEYDGMMKAGFRFWSLDWENKPVTVVVYEEDGYTKYRTKPDSKGLDIAEYEKKRAYKQTIAHNEVDPDEILDESNYSTIPIIPFWGNKIHQSDLVGMRAKIDSYDLVMSGFANNLEDCQEIFWIIGNALGMTDGDLAKFRDRLKLQHMAVMDTDNTNLTPYTQEIPVAARETLLQFLRSQLYEDYGGLDVHTVSAGSTNDHIDMVYQSMDDEADEFEYEVIKTVKGVLAIIGEDAVPVFHRNKISNQLQQMQMLMLGAQFLDRETIIRKMPFVTPDEVEDILSRVTAEEQLAFIAETGEQPEV